MADFNIEEHILTLPQLQNRKRTVRVLLPPGYHDEPARRYPVLYMHDGHNLFFADTATYGTHWQIGETMNAMAAAGDPRRIIIVGVDCNHGRDGIARLDEYSPWINTGIGELLSRADGVTAAGGEGAAYTDFITDTLISWTDRHYRTIAAAGSRAIAGSSMGGLISLYALYQKPDCFRLAGAFSSAFWFAKEQVLEHLAAHYRPGKAVYLDIGTAETSDPSKPDFARRYLQDTLDVRDYLVSCGQELSELPCVIEEAAVHNEAAWARRFPGFIDWALQRLEGALPGEQK